MPDCTFTTSKQSKTALDAEPGLAPCGLDPVLPYLRHEVLDVRVMVLEDVLLDVGGGVGQGGLKQLGVLSEEHEPWGRIEGG